MKTMMNITTYCDDVDRFVDADDLRAYLAGHRLDGVELMHLAPDERGIVPRDAVVGVHLPYYVTWLDFWRGNEAGLMKEFGSWDVVRSYYGGADRSCIVRRFKDALAAAHAYDAEYVVFHVGESGARENFTFEFARSDEEVVDAACEVLNEVFAEEDGSIALLLENLWEPGLTMLRPEMTARLLDGVAYENTGIMLDTGHLLHTDFDLKTQEEGVAYIMRRLDEHDAFGAAGGGGRVCGGAGGRGSGLCARIRGVHFQQSLTGEYCKRAAANPPDLSGSYDDVYGLGFMHAFSVDKHEPWTTPAARAILERLSPEWCTLEYITSSREQHDAYLRAGAVARP